MKVLYSSIFILGLAANVGLFMPPAFSVDVTDNQAIVDYPEMITFKLQASSDEVIDTVELIFGSDVLACGENSTRAFPEDYEPSQSVDVEWEYNLRRNGTLPPGTQVWWQWKLTDAQGNETLTPRQTLTFTDESMPWKVYATDSVEIHWIEGSQNFARQLAQAGETALEYLYEITGVKLDQVVRVYVYPSAGDMQTATLFAPDWSGGIAFAEYRTVLAGISPDQLDWGREVVAHELTHVLIGIHTFSCVGYIPIWLNEGLAMYAENSVGTSHADDYNRLNDAIENDDLLTAKEVSSIFSNDPDLARQAYAQSLSLVEFLIEEYGPEKMLNFLDEFKDGSSQDQALTQVYGLNQDSLYNVWREWIGAAPAEATAVVQATPTRTPYPTFPPITGYTSATLTPTATSAPQVGQVEATATVLKPVTEIAPEDTSSGASRVLIFVGIGVVLVLALITIILVAMGKRSNGE